MKITLEQADIDSMIRSGGRVFVKINGFASSQSEDYLLFKGQILLEDAKIYVKAIETEAKNHFSRDS